jgi:hypothetical protein
LLDNAHAKRRALVARQAGSVLLRIDDLTIRAAVDSGRELLPFVRRIKASMLPAAQSKVFRNLKRTAPEHAWIRDVVLLFS